MRRLGAAALAASLVSCASPSEPDAIAVIEVNPTAHQLLVGPSGGQTVQLAAVAKRANGSVIEGVTFTWGTATPTIVSVDATGLVTSVGPGTGIVAAFADDEEGDALVEVLPVPAKSFTISVDAVALEVSPLGFGTHQLDGVLRDSLGATITGRQIGWGSTAPGVATVSNAGLIRAVAAGAAKIIGGREGRTDTVEVTVTESSTLPGDADIAISDVQWTQGVQLADGSLPMIRHGRAAVVNVLLSANYSIATPSSVTLRLREAGGAIAHTQSKPVVVPTGIPATMAAPHVQFLVPNDLLLPGRTWEVLRDTEGALPDASAATDLFPRAGATPLALVSVPLLRIRLVPVQLLAHGGTTPNLTAGQIEDYIRTLRQLHPHGEIEVTIGTPHATAQSFGTAPNGGAVGFWSPLLAELDVARVADVANADAHWIGIVAPPGGFNFTSFGGFGYIPSNGASSGPQTRTSTLIRLGWFLRESQTRDLVAHELGHNFGRFHAPCGGAAGPDPLYPRPDGTVGPGGHDVFGWSEGSLASAPAIADGVGDIMGYCSPLWISRYTYAAVLDFRGASGAVALRTAPSRARVLVVRGQVSRGVVTLAPALTLEAMATPSDPGGEVLLEAIAADGRVLATHRVRLGTFDHDPTARPFAANLPLDAAFEEALVEIRARTVGGEARRRSIGVALREPGAASLRIESVAGGTSLGCPAPTAALVVLDGAGRVRAIAAGASITLPQPPANDWRVSCSDGVRSRAFIARR